MFSWHILKIEMVLVRPPLWNWSVQKKKKKIVAEEFLILVVDIFQNLKLHLLCMCVTEVYMSVCMCAGMGVYRKQGMDPLVLSVGRGSMWSLAQLGQGLLGTGK